MWPSMWSRLSLGHPAPRISLSFSRWLLVDEGGGLRESFMFGQPRWSTSRRCIGREEILPAQKTEYGAMTRWKRGMRFGLGSLAMLSILLGALTLAISNAATAAAPVTQR
jgi:hypothetical protein